MITSCPTIQPTHAAHSSLCVRMTTHPLSLRLSIQVKNYTDKLVADPPLTHLVLARSSMSHRPHTVTKIGLSLISSGITPPTATKYWIGPLLVGASCVTWEYTHSFPYAGAV
jgi:hypothetical protein